ncbi:hypothetical protein ILUMI_13677 [Ignelater luminosus]|uniref:Retrotransposon gag domain-containing protein n=1 Tax=Ignelater luminosus TaxID=2038154 RepID=A0A8K0GAP4_IGNLU|nr:hypothetical protein ILUMI_13677 [Ignelater luminosus]
MKLINTEDHKLSKAELMLLVDEYANLALTKNNSFPCEVLIGSQSIEREDEEHNYYFLLYRYHHALADGVALTKLTIASHAYREQNTARASGKDFNVLLFLKLFIEKLLAFILIPSWYVSSLILRGRDKNILKGNKLSNQYHFAANVEDSGYFDLFNAAIELFKGDALIWYRSIRDTMNSWSELVRELQKAFLPCDYEQNLWEESRHRNQGAHESVSVYIAIMENFFRRLSSIPNEPTRVDIIRRDLSPYLQSQLALEGTTKICRLTQLGKAIKEAYTRAFKLKASSTDFRQALEPYLVYGYNCNGQPSRLAKFESVSTSYPTSDLGRGSFGEGDERVAIFGNSFLSLFDSEASHTILGQSGWNKLKHLCSLSNTKKTTCAIANGSTCHSKGTITVPISLRDKTKLSDVLVVPSVPDSLILGTDSWRAMASVSDLRHNKWTFIRLQSMFKNSAFIEEISIILPVLAGSMELLHINKLAPEDVEVQNNYSTTTLDLPICVIKTPDQFSTVSRLNIISRKTKALGNFFHYSINKLIIETVWSCLPQPLVAYLPKLTSYTGIFSLLPGMPRIVVDGFNGSVTVSDFIPWNPHVFNIDLNIDKSYFWCDSKTDLSWIAAEPSVWKTFIRNRVGQIQELAGGGTWNHVESAHNPADIISRGCTLEQIRNSGRRGYKITKQIGL